MTNTINMDARARSALLLRSAAALALSTLSALSACTPPMDRVELRLDSTPPVGVTLGGDRIQIAHGIAAGVTVIPIAQGEEVSSAVSMTSSDSSIFGVESVSGNLFILYGTFPGDGSLHIAETSTGALVDVPVTVVTQP